MNRVTPEIILNNPRLMFHNKVNHVSAVSPKQFHIVKPNLILFTIEEASTKA